MIRAFVGWDSRETVAYPVLSHSIIRTCSSPVSISPVGNDTLPPELWWRERGPHDSTDFSNARFAVPALCDYKGWALFMDCDMVCLDDLAELWNQRDERYSVMVRKHDHVPTKTSKFLGAPQARYARKNWSSLMLLNCAHPDTRHLDARYINSAAGLDLHGFAWTTEANIGEIVGSWNELVLDGATMAAAASMPHFTEGGPWHGYVGSPYAESWCNLLDDMMADGNPLAESTYRRRYSAGGQALEYQVAYARRE
jgi:hypothetical protein